MSKKRKRGTSRQQQKAAAQARRQIPDIARGREAASGQAPGASRETAHEVPSPVQRHYLDVAAVRIQEWLSRTSDLKMRRGASVLLTQATEKREWVGSLPANVEWNDEAGDLAGVVSLVLMTDDEAAVTDPATTFEAIAREVASAVRQKIPHCSLQATWGSGLTYAEAYPELEARRRRGELLLDVPAAPPETVLAKPCDACRQASATQTVQLIDGGQDFCGECANRWDAAGGTAGPPRRAPLPERRLKEALGVLGSTGQDFPDDFRQLAQAGRLSDDDAPTQIALIYADGNKVGTFLDDLASRAPGQVPKNEIVTAIDLATMTALARAVAQTYPETARPAALVHVAGGDDLMVSVPARHAWPFVRRLLAAFGEEIDDRAKSWRLTNRFLLPSMSAGVVFHHYSHPFSDAVSLATRQLKTAKRGVNGIEAAVAFLDLTADGDRPPRGRPIRSLNWLESNASQLDALAAVPESHRQTLAALVRQAAEPGGLKIDDGESPAQALGRRVVDLGHSVLLAVVADADADPEEVRARLAGNDSQAREQLRHYLDLARWWPDPHRIPTRAGAVS